MSYSDYLNLKDKLKKEAPTREIDYRVSKIQNAYFNLGVNIHKNTIIKALRHDFLSYGRII